MTNEEHNTGGSRAKDRLRGGYRLEIKNSGAWGRRNLDLTIVPSDGHLRQDIATPRQPIVSPLGYVGWAFASAFHSSGICHAHTVVLQS